MVSYHPTLTIVSAIKVEGDLEDLTIVDSPNIIHIKPLHVLRISDI